MSVVSSPLVNSSSAEKGVEELAEVLRAAGGMAALSQLNKKFKKRFGYSFEESWAKNFGVHHVQSLSEHPSFDAKFSAIPTEQGTFVFHFKNEGGRVLQGISQLAAVLSDLGGSASHSELIREYLKRFGTTFGKCNQKYFGQPTLVHLVKGPVFSSAFSASQDAEGDVKLSIKSIRITRNASSLSPVFMANAVKAESQIEEDEPKEKPPGPLNDVVMRSVRRMRGVLKELGGSAKLAEIERKFQELFRTPFWKVRSLDFPEMTVPAIFELPAFSAEFYSTKEQGSARRYHLKGVSPEVPPVDTPSPALNLNEMVARGIAQLKEALVACGGFATYDLWSAKLKELFGVELDIEWISEHFEDGGFTEFTKTPIFKAAFVETKIPPDRFIFRQRLLEADQKESDAGWLENAMFLKGVEQLKTVLEALEGSATKDQLSAEYKKRFGIVFEKSYKNYFGVKKLKDFVEKPYFKSSFAAVQQCDGSWRFFLKSLSPDGPEEDQPLAKKRKQMVKQEVELAVPKATDLTGSIPRFSSGFPAMATPLEQRGIKKLSGYSRDMIEKTVKRLKYVLELLGGSATLDEIDAKCVECFLTSFLEIRNFYLPGMSFDSMLELPAFNKFYVATETDGVSRVHLRAGPEPNPEDMEMRGIAQLKEALAACGGFATFVIWRTKFKELFGVALAKDWLNEHFGDGRFVEFTKTPIFKAAFIETKIRPHRFVFRERLPEVVEAAEKEETARWLENALALEGAKQLKTVLKALSGSASHGQLNREYQKQFGLSFEKSYENYFGVGKIRTLVEHPFFKSLFEAVCEGKLSWRFFLKSSAFDGSEYSLNDKNTTREKKKLTVRVNGIEGNWRE